MAEPAPGTIRMNSIPRAGDDGLSLEFDYRFSRSSDVVDPWITVVRISPQGGERPVAFLKMFLSNPASQIGGDAISLTTFVFAPGCSSLPPIEAGEYIVRIISGSNVLSEGRFTVLLPPGPGR